MTYRMMLVAAAVLTCACGVETPEEAATWADHDAGLSRSAALPACTNTTSSFTVNSGDDICGAAPNYWLPGDNNECGTGDKPFSAAPKDTCDLAEGLLEEPGACPKGCTDGGVSDPSTEGTATSCKASQYRNCSEKKDATSSPVE